MLRPVNRVRAKKSANVDAQQHGASFIREVWLHVPQRGRFGFRRSAFGQRRAALILTMLTALWGPALATAQNANAPVTVQVSFNPKSITSITTSQLTIALGNGNPTAATLSQPLVDSLPGGLTIVGVGKSTAPCPGGFTANAGVISYPGGASIPAKGCSIVVTVKGTSTSGSTYYTDTIPAGALQTNNFGSNVSGASATLTISAEISVPNLTGLSQTAAAAKLQAVGLALGTVTSGPSSEPFNLVFAQTIRNKSVAPGTAVGISISTGPCTKNCNPRTPLTSLPLANPTQTSVASALQQVCASLQAPSTPTLTTAQSRLLANCNAIISTYGGGGGGASGPANLQKALDAVSGKQTTAQQTTSIQFSGLQFSNLASRLAELRGGSTGFSFAGLDTGAPMQSSLGQLIAALQDRTGSNGSQSGGQQAPSSAQVAGGGSGDPGADNMLSRWGFFVNGTVRRGSQDTTDEETGYDFKSNGVTAGADYRFTSHIVAGIAYGHANGNTEFTDGSGRVDSRSNTVSLYGSYYQGAFYLDLIGTFGHISFDEFRDTTYTIAPNLASIPKNCLGTTCTVEADGESGARQLAFGGDLGYDFHAGGLVYGPDLALDYTRVDVNAFTETDLNDSGMALSYGDQIGESLLLKAGGHLSYAISTPFAVILPQVRARYVHEFKDDQRGLLVHYVNDPTVNSSTSPLSNFFVFTDLPDRNYFDWAAGLTAQFAFGLAAYVDYSALGGYTGLEAHEISFGIRFQYLVR
jgi:outer membrane lipase/esterase